VFHSTCVLVVCARACVCVCVDCVECCVSVMRCVGVGWCGLCVAGCGACFLVCVCVLYDVCVLRGMCVYCAMRRVFCGVCSVVWRCV